MPRGGKRPGAGRKKRAETQAVSQSPAAPSVNSDNHEKRIGAGKPGPGRPPGVPNKVNAALKGLAQEFTTEAVRGLVAVARHPKTPAAAKIAAWREVLDRGHGKPKEFHDHTHRTKPDLTKLNEAELAALEQIVAKAVPQESEATVH